MEHDRELERQRYELCRLGFVLMSAALVLACTTSLLEISLLFHGRRGIPWLLHSRFWQWIDTPIVWGSLLGCYLLWGRWDEPTWQRRVGLLLVMCMVDVALWTMEHGQSLGINPIDFGHEWFRHILGRALGWAEFALIASITSGVLVHLGVDAALETGRATRSLAATGAVIWFVHFVTHTAWGLGWPLLPRRNGSLVGLLSMLGSTMVGTIVLIQVTALTIAAARQCGVVLAEMRREEVENDPLRSAHWDELETLRAFGDAGQGLS